jgi:hypothetical protein
MQLLCANMGLCFIYLRDDYRFRINVDGKAIHVLARSSEAFSDIGDVVLRLLAASVVHSLEFFDTCLGDASANATSLAYLMEQCQGLKSLTLGSILLDEDCIRALGNLFKARPRDRAEPLSNHRRCSHSTGSGPWTQSGTDQA